MLAGTFVHLAVLSLSVPTLISSLSAYISTLVSLTPGNVPGLLPLNHTHSDGKLGGARNKARYEWLHMEFRRIQRGGVGWGGLQFFFMVNKINMKQVAHDSVNPIQYQVTALLRVHRYCWCHSPSTSTCCPCDFIHMMNAPRPFHFPQSSISAC